MSCPQLFSIEVPRDLSKEINKEIGISISHRRLSILEFSSENDQCVIAINNRFVIDFNVLLFLWIGEYAMQFAISSILKNLVDPIYSFIRMMFNAHSFRN